MGELMGFGPQGQPLTPIAAGLSPSDMTLYVKHVKAYRSQLSPTPGNALTGCEQASRAPLRTARIGSRAGRLVPSTSVPSTPQLAVIDTEVRERYQLATWAAPLMSDVIPPGGPHLCRIPRQHSWSPLQSFWTLITVPDTRKRVETTWMRNCNVPVFPREVSHVFVIDVAPCLSLLGKDKSSIRPPCHLPLPSLPESPHLTDYERYYSSVLLLSGLLPFIPPHASCVASWQQDYEEHLQCVSPHGLAPRPPFARPPGSDDDDFLLYFSRVQQITPSVPMRPFHRRHLLHRRDRLGSPLVQTSPWEEEFHR